MATTEAQLHRLVLMIDQRLDLTPGTHDLDLAYGGARLVRHGGSVDVSPRLPKGELESWIRAFLAGIDAAQGGAGSVRTL